MSRVGEQPVTIPDGVKVNITGRVVTVEGKLGKLDYEFRPEVNVDLEENKLVVKRTDDERQTRAYHGMTRSLLYNMVVGVTEGYTKAMEVYGVGYGVQLNGKTLTINCGKSHPELLDVPEGVTVDIQSPQARGDIDPAKFTVSGCDKQSVGAFAAQCRDARPPEPYKGKGVRYADEQVRRKVGKAMAGAE